MKKMCSGGMFDPLSIGKYASRGTSEILKPGIKTFMDITHAQWDGMASPDTAETFNAGIQKYVYKSAIDL